MIIGQEFDTAVCAAANVVMLGLLPGSAKSIIFNECNMMDINLANLSCAGATGVSAVLSSTTPDVSVEQPNSPYANLPIGGNATNAVPFQFSTSPSFVCGTTINFTLTVTTSQGVFVFNFNKPTCAAAPINLSGSNGAGDPTQTGRLFRNGVASSCAVPKATPTLVDSVARRYDAYTFTNTTGCYDLRHGERHIGMRHQPLLRHLPWSI